jgi:hypothetical protein
MTIRTARTRDTMVSQLEKTGVLAAQPTHVMICNQNPLCVQIIYFLHFIRKNVSSQVYALRKQVGDLFG